MEINLDFEYLDKLPVEEYNKIERRFLDYFQKLLISSEEDYCKKKGLSREEIFKNYKLYSNMRIAVDKRKAIKKEKRNLMMFNRMMRPFISEK